MINPILEDSDIRTFALVHLYICSQLRAAVDQVYYLPLNIWQLFERCYKDIFCATWNWRMFAASLAQRVCIMILPDLLKQIYTNTVESRKCALIGKNEKAIRYPLAIDGKK